MEEGKYSENFYSGADYGFTPEYGKEFSTNMTSYKFPVSQFGLTTDPRTSAQLKAVSDKLSTGAKTIEVTGITPGVVESIPQQHLKELDRLRKLVGIDLTFHGPLIEPTGFQGRQGWQEINREQAERQMWSAVERAHELNPDGNVIVTFHSSNGLMDPETKVKDGKREQIKDVWIVNEEDGQFGSLPLDPNYFKSEEGQFQGKDVEAQRDAIKDILKERNKEIWYNQTQNISFHVDQGSRVLEKALGSLGDKEKDGKEKKAILEVYKDYINGGDVSKALDKIGEPYKEMVKEKMQEIVHGDFYFRDSYQKLQKLFNDAYAAAKKSDRTDDIKRLDDFRGEIKDKLKDIESPEKLQEFANTIVEGVNVLRSIKAPQFFRPVREFGIDKSSDTFANVAFNAYEKFKDSAPILSIENPPVGMGLTRGEDLKDVVDASRKKLSEKLVNERGLSEHEAKKQAEKLIGVTWDVGHINMLRKYGYTDDDIVAQTKKVAKDVKHVHLSDNFGMEHTELPMGMGNVPLKPMLDAIHQFNKQAKKIIETGGAWYQDFKVSPLRETLRAFGSPLYSMKMAPHWGNYSNTSEGYFSGYGRFLPEQHFSMYGSGFSNLPPELGGQLSGRSRASGTPID